MRPSNLLLCLALGAAALACGDRDDSWDATLEAKDYPPTSVGLAGAVAIYDRPLDRVALLSARGDLTLDPTFIPVGKNMATMVPSADRSELYVLSRGVQPRRDPSDELPSLMIIEGDTSPTVKKRYELTDPLSGLAVDPLGEWVVVFDAGGVVVNPNELILLKVDDPNAEPVTKTIRSFGGRPQRLTFTQQLSLPQGPPRRLLIVETEQDVALIDLQNLQRDEVTVVLPQTLNGQPSSPAEVAVHDGDPEDPNDARIAVRLAGDSDVMLLELDPPPPSEEGEKDFKLTVNVADVGGIPSAIDFVETDGGLRLAALVPTARQATLVDPATTVVESVSLPGSYSRITRVTEQVAERPDQGDVALLWGASPSEGIAFWSLGRTTGRPYRSVDAYPIGITVQSVQDVPGGDLGHRKILVNQSADEFYVLDLNQRTTFPMLTSTVGFDLSVAPDGGRAWAVRTGTTELAQINLETLHPTSLEIERDITRAYDIERQDGGRAIVSLHAVGTLGATVMDALDPDSAETRFYGGLLLGGL